MRHVLRCAVALLVSGAFFGAAAAREGALEAPAVRVRFEINPLVDCYFMLKTYGRDLERAVRDPNAALTSEADLFKRAVVTLQDQAAWRWFEDQVIAGPDTGALRATMKTLPAALDSPRTRTGLNMLLDGLESAYPKFLGGWWAERQRSLNRILVPVRKQWMPVEPRLADTWIKKAVFSPIDAPIVVFLTMRAGGAGSWGKSGGGYYTVVGIQGMSVPITIETGLHEATHILDTMQPFDSRSVYKRVRQGLGDATPEDLDTFVHGLVAYNAGALVRRFVDHEHRPAGILAPSHRDEYAPYVSTYDVVWNAYLDGKLDADKVVAKLIEEFRAVRKFEEAKKKPS